MKYLPLILLFTSCSMKPWYPTIGGGIGAGTGSLLGPGGAVAGSVAGTLAGEVAKGNAQIKEQADTIRALSHGDVEELVAQGMAQHKTGFDEFTGYVKRILMIAGILLGCYLVIPIFVAKRCSKNEIQRGLTRVPFPRPSDKNEKSKTT